MFVRQEEDDGDDEVGEGGKGGGEDGGLGGWGCWNVWWFRSRSHWSLKGPLMTPFPLE